MKVLQFCEGLQYDVLECADINHILNYLVGIQLQRTLYFVHVLYKLTDQKSKEVCVYVYTYT